MFRNAFVICMLLILASMASHYAMAADSCQPVFDAITKIVTTPSHSYSTGVLNGKDAAPRPSMSKERLT
jgi:hypothetical protein